LIRVFAKIGLLGFGGPAAQIALMHRIVVEEKRWLSEGRYLHALNYCMLLPGPEAQQLATYIGWLARGVKGGIAAGILFVLPGAVIMLALSVLYALFAELPLMQGVFYGIKCAVLAIVVQALLRIGGRALKTSALRLIALAAFCALFLFALPFPLVVLSAGVIGFLLHRTWPGTIVASGGHGAGKGGAHSGSIDAAIEDGRIQHTKSSATRFMLQTTLWLTLWLAPVAVLWLALGPDDLLTRLGLFFAQMAAVTFGGAYAVLAYVAQEAVSTYGWLSAKEMLHGLALAETTPGPLILVLQYVGFLAGFRDAVWGGIAGGIIASLLVLWVTFVPSFLWIFAGAPYAERLRSMPGISAALAAITAAVTGVIASLALWFALHVLFARVDLWRSGPFTLNLPDWATLDPAALALTLAALVLTLRFKLGVGWLVLIFAATGLARTALV